MDKISQYLKQEYKFRNDKQKLTSENEVVVASLVGLGVSGRNEVLLNEEFDNWNKNFNQSFQERWNEYSVNREQTLEQYKELLQEIGTNPNGESASEIQRIISNLRSQDVQSRWEFETFFANEGGPATQSTLGYYDFNFEENNSTFVNYTDEQFNILQQGDIVRINDKALEGHHMNDVSTHALDSDMMDVTFNANNINFLTREAHLYSTEFGHGGSWQNSTESSAFSVFDTKENLIQENKIRTDSEISNFNIETALGIGAAAGLITFCIELYKTKNDPRSWKKRAAIVGGNAIKKGAVVSALSGVANHTRTSVLSSFSNNIEPEIGFADEIISNSTSFLETTSDMGLDHFDIIVASGISIAEIRIIYQGFSSVSTWRMEGRKKALNQFGNNVIKILNHEAKFVGAGFLLDFLIPDPTGILFVLRIGDAAFKWGKDIHTFKTCNKIKTEAQYQLAMNSLKLLN